LQLAKKKAKKCDLKQSAGINCLSFFALYSNIRFWIPEDQLLKKLQLFFVLKEQKNNQRIRYVTSIPSGNCLHIPICSLEHPTAIVLIDDNCLMKL
jgi:hypothetical protein